jgi:hypothetical protein
MPLPPALKILLPISYGTLSFALSVDLFIYFFVVSHIAFSLLKTISTNSSCNCDRKIHKALPHALELLELSANKEFPMIGLRINFPDALSPFAFVCQNQVNLPATIHAKSLFLNIPFGCLVFSLKIIFSSVYPKK